MFVGKTTNIIILEGECTIYENLSQIGHEYGEAITNLLQGPIKIILFTY